MTREPTLLIHDGVPAEVETADLCGSASTVTEACDAHESPETEIGAAETGVPRK